MNINYESSIDRLIGALERKHWKVSHTQNKKVSFGIDLRSRYKVIPEDFLLFLSRVESCVDPTGKIWFLTKDDYNEKLNKPLAWNFCESLSLEAAKADNNLDEEVRVKRFWSHFLPIALSAKAEFVYLAIGVHPSTFGQIVYGIEPEFEESAEVICKSFSQLCNQYADMCDGKLHSYELEDFM